MIVVAGYLDTPVAVCHHRILSEDLVQVSQLLQRELLTRSLVTQQVTPKPARLASGHVPNIQTGCPALSPLVVPLGTWHEGQPYTCLGQVSQELCSQRPFPPLAC